ncbi:MAG TPA: GNAT family N-acetyltransferase, partial [Pilimelia sp.]|nr:GNAT family N-acetyltransferase [Pilimelia sp.]
RPARAGDAAAGPADTDAVLAVLDEAAAWLAHRGIAQWPARFDPGWVTGAVGRGETWLVRDAGEVLATFTLAWSDPLWPAPGGDTAGYLHRLAVRRRAAGLGSVLLRWAGAAARARGRRYLRLDCVATNEGLRAYYEAAGFAHRGDVEVRGNPGQRAAAGPATVVSRYERRLAG